MSNCPWRVWVIWWYSNLSDFWSPCIFISCLFLFQVTFTEMGIKTTKAMTLRKPLWTHEDDLKKINNFCQHDPTKSLFNCFLAKNFSFRIPSFSFYKQRLKLLINSKVLILKVAYQLLVRLPIYIYYIYIYIYIYIESKER